MRPRRCYAAHALLLRIDVMLHFMHMPRKESSKIRSRQGDHALLPAVSCAPWQAALLLLYTSCMCAPATCWQLQIEHHLFPAISFVHYPAIARIVAEECAAAGVRYVHYQTLGGALVRFVTCLRELGSAPDDAAAGAAALKVKAA
eukprot:GHRQ01038472.1.p1 GENE.GHRQ01038472.1~~GHRQ01038472.1.p1  ORF type:complete len:145 (-),score=22.36 GHRQ01038472.1:24-458(-)